MSAKTSSMTEILQLNKANTNEKQMKNILGDLTFEIQRLNSNLEYLGVDKPMTSQQPVPNRILK